MIPVHRLLFFLAFFLLSLGSNGSLDAVPGHRNPTFGDDGSDLDGELGITMEVPAMKDPPGPPLHCGGASGVPAPPQPPACTFSEGSGVGENDPLHEAYREMLEEYYRTRQLEYRHRVDVFHWQLYSGQAIFWIVIGMVITGLLFSALQFQEALFPSAVLGRQLKLLRSLEASRRGSDSSASAGLKKEIAGETPQQEMMPPTSMSPFPPSSIRELFFTILPDIALSSVGCVSVKWVCDSSLPFSPLTEISASGVQIQSPVLGLIILVVSFAFFYLYLVHVHPIQELVLAKVPPLR